MRRPASGGWVTSPAPANERGVELAELPMTPADVARLDALVTAGTLNDTLARQVVEGVLAGEGRPGRRRRRPRDCRSSPTRAR